MNTLLADKSQNNIKVNPARMPGAMGWIDEIGFEMESPSVSSVAQSIGGGAAGVFEGALGLIQNVAGVEPQNDTLESKQISPTGTIEFNKAEAKAEEQEKNRQEKDRKKTFYQTLKDDQLRAQMAKDRMWMEEEINDKISGFSTEQTNELLHLQADYKDNKSVYHRAELRKKLIEQKRLADKQQKAASIPSPAKKIYALEGAFEGASGKVGSGTANFGKGSVQ